MSSSQVAGPPYPAEGLQGFGFRVDVALESREERPGWEEPTSGTFRDHWGGGWEQPSQEGRSVLERGDKACSSLGRAGNSIQERTFR